MFAKEMIIYSGSFPTTGSVDGEGNLIAPVSSSKFKQVAKWEIDPDDPTSIQFRIPSASIGANNDRIAFYISGSGKIGIGTKDPETAFDIRDLAEDKDDKGVNRKESIFKADRTAGNVDIKATSLRTARTIGGVSFDGSTNINLPGVNTAGNQNTTGNAATATTLETARTIGGVSFNGSANIDLPGVNLRGSQNTTGNAATATTALGITAGKVTLTFSVNKSTLTITDGNVTWTLQGK
tara:strand:+ start:345 stop:1058 length:714 start_codon:yes stop_codon:yes gene_type:complete